MKAKWVITLAAGIVLILTQCSESFAQSSFSRQNQRYRSYASTRTYRLIPARKIEPAPVPYSFINRRTRSDKPTSPAETSGQKQPAHSARPSAKAAESPRRPQRQSQNSDYVLDLLVHKRISVSYQSLPLEFVIDDLREQFGVNMLVFWPEMQLGGYPQDTEVTLELNNIPAYVALDAVLQFVSAGSPRPLDWTVYDGLLVVNLKDRLVIPREVRVYYVGDLLAPESRYGESILIDTNGTGGFGNRSSGRTGSRGSSGRSQSGIDRFGDDRAEELRSQINRALGTPDNATRR